jgi:hypothetical protein
VPLDDEDIKEFGLDGYDEEEGGEAVLMGMGNDEDMSEEGDAYGGRNGNFEVILYHRVHIIATLTVFSYRCLY